MHLSFVKSGGIIRSSSPDLRDWCLVIILSVIAFICYDQAFDMTLTMLQASDLLHCTFSGKPSAFYSYCLQKAAAGEYLGADENTTGASYNIVLYIVMAIWALPVYLLNLAVRFSKYGVILSSWGRIFVIGLSVYCSHLITRLSAKLMTDPVKAKWAGYYFLSSPIFMCCVIIQNQYDILAVTVMLLALFFYFDKKYYAFSAIISLAVCFKWFPLLIFAPLILLAEKRIGKLILHAAISVSFYSATTLISTLADPGYRASQELLKANYDFFDRVFSAQISGGVSNISIFVFLMILVCVIAYYLKPDHYDFAAAAFFLCAASCVSFFVFVEFHPQWFIIFLPFLTMLVFSMKSFRSGVLLDTFATAAFLLLVSLKYLGSYIMDNSILVNFTSGRFNLSDNANPLYNFFAVNGYTLVPVLSIFAGLLSALLLTAYMDFKSGRDNGSRMDQEIKIERRLLYLRSIMILIYIAPPVVYYLTSPAV